MLDETKVGCELGLDSDADDAGDPEFDATCGE